MFNYMLRVNITIAIVSMVVDTEKDTHLMTNGNIMTNGHSIMNGHNTSYAFTNGLLNEGGKGVESEALVSELGEPDAPKGHSMFEGHSLVNSDTSDVGKFEESNTTDFVVGKEHPYSIIDERGRTRFFWDKYAQGEVLGSFYIGYILTELPGGRMAEVIGAKKVFGGGMLAASLLTLFTPLTCSLSVMAVVVLRGLLGFFLGE